MGIAGAIAVGVPAVFSAFNSMQAGNSQADSAMVQGEYNAGIYESQAAVVAGQQKVANYQYGRKAGKMRGTAVATTAAKGLDFSGSPLRIMAENESQLLFDQAINNYNLETQKNYYKSEAAMSRYSGGVAASTARSQGFSNAFTTLLSAGTSIAGMNFGRSGGSGYSSPFTTTGNTPGGSLTGYRRI